MKEQPPKEFVFECPAEEIASYIDGELSAAAEAALEAHLYACGVCRSELNEQKGFLLALSDSFARDADIDLPKDFTRRIVINAESSVSTLRSGGEKLLALAAAAMLLLFGAVLALGESSAGPALIERLAAAVGFGLELVYDLAYGISNILRSLAASQTFAPHIAYIVLGLGAAAIALLAVSPLKRYLRPVRSE